MHSQFLQKQVKKQRTASEKDLIFWNFEVFL